MKKVFIKLLCAMIAMVMTVMAFDIAITNGDIRSIEYAIGALLFMISDTLASKIQDLKLKVTDGTTSHIIQLQ